MLKWFYSLKSNYKGTVTIFISLILIPSIAFTGFFVDFARVKLYKQQAISTTDVYANSVLSYYNGLLQDIYGLYGLSDMDFTQINNALESYAKTSFNPKEYSAEQSSVEKLVDKFINSSSKTTTGFMPYANADVSFEYSKIDNMNLGNSDILINQIADYSKYLVPISLIKDKINDIDNISQPSQTDTDNNPDDDLFDAIDDDSTSADSRLLHEKNQLDTKLQDLSAKCKEYYNNLVEMNKYTQKSNEIKTLRDNILNTINNPNNNLIDFINSKNEEYANLQNDIVTTQNEINNLNEILSQQNTTLNNISDETKKIYQDNLDIKQYNQNSNAMFVLDTCPNKEYLKSLGYNYQQINQEFKKYNLDVEAYNNSNTEKILKVEYDVNPNEQSFYDQLETIYSTISELENNISILNQQISVKSQEIDVIQNDIKNRIIQTDIKNQILRFETVEEEIKEYQKYLENLTDICNSICSLQAQVTASYNRCQHLLEDVNVSNEVRNQVTSDLSQIKPLIDYDFKSLTNTIVSTNKDVLNNDINAIHKYLGNDEKGFKALFNYCESPIYTDIIEVDLTKYKAHILNKSNYDENIQHTFGQYYIDMKRDQNNFPKISLVDSNGVTTNIGIFDYLERSYMSNGVSTDSRTPTSEESANSTASQNQENILKQLNDKINEIKEKLNKTIPDEYWNEFSTIPSIDNTDKTSLNMEIGEKFNFGNIVSEGINKVLVEEYDYRMFSNYTTNPNLEDDEKPMTLSYIPIDTTINYLMNSELEYIYAGKQTSKENIEEVCFQIFSIRFVLDFISTFKIKEINSLINSIRDTVSAAATPVIGVLVSGIVRVTVAMMMGVSDVIKLLDTNENNDGVVLFQTELDDLSASDKINEIFGSFTSNTIDNNNDTLDIDKNTDNDKNKVKKKFSLKYTDYLRLMILIFRDTNTISLRTGDLIELNMNNYITGANGGDLTEHSFKMSNSATMINAKVTIKENFLFTNFFLTDSFIPNQDTKNSMDIFTKQGYSYTLKKGY